MKRWFRDIFLRLFCTHPVILAPESAHKRLNWNNTYKVTCVTCSQVLRRKGLTIGRYREKECLCLMEKP